MQKKAIYVIFILLLMIFCIFKIKIKEKGTIEKPNILLITVCFLRQDHLSCYGYQRLTSPNIDQLAKTSTLFKNCYTHEPWTITSTRALLTGKYPTASLDTDKEVKLTEFLQSIGC